MKDLIQKILHKEVEISSLTNEQVREIIKEVDKTHSMKCNGFSCSNCVLNLLFAQYINTKESTRCKQAFIALLTEQLNKPEMYICESAGICERDCYHRQKHEKFQCNGICSGCKNTICSFACLNKIENG
jgi:hypothetical protein